MQNELIVFGATTSAKFTYIRPFLNPLEPKFVNISVSKRKLYCRPVKLSRQPIYITLQNKIILF